MEADLWVVLFCLQVEEGWWKGTANGKSGLFPSNFVEELETAGEEAEPKNTSANVTGNSTVTNPDRGRGRQGGSATASSGLGVLGFW